MAVPPKRNVIPVGVERVLSRAACDEAFKRDLLARGALAAQDAGIALTASERAVLDAIPADQLDRMIDLLPPDGSPAYEAEQVLCLGIRPEQIREDRHDVSCGIRPTIPLAAAAVAGTVLVAGGGAMLMMTHGARPDMPPPTQVKPSDDVSGDAGADASDANDDG